jgi:hypothetical protein
MYGHNWLRLSTATEETETVMCYKRLPKKRRKKKKLIHDGNIQSACYYSGMRPV